MAFGLAIFFRLFWADNRIIDLLNIFKTQLKLRWELRITNYGITVRNYGAELRCELR